MWEESSLKNQNVTPLQYQQGRQQIIIPGKIVKYVYREGVGNYPLPQQTILAFYSCYLISGKLVGSSYQNIKKFTIGLGRLIQGLQIGLLKCKKLQKFKLIISSDYAYGNRQNIKNIPPNSKLIFTFEIYNIQQKNKKLQQCQIYARTYKYLKKVDQLILRQDFQTSLIYLDQAYLTMRMLNYQRSQLSSKILCKWIRILIYLKRQQDAQTLLNLLLKNNTSYLPAYEIKLLIYRQKNIQADLYKQLKIFYYNNFENQLIKKFYVDYLRSIGSYDQAISVQTNQIQNMLKKQRQILMSQRSRFMNPFFLFRM